MQHGDVENRISYTQMALIPRKRSLAAIVFSGFFLLSGIAVADTTPPAAAPTTCPTANCSGTAGQVAHCETNSGGTGACASGGACTAKGCAGGCTGSFFSALGQAESGDSYSNSSNPIGCLGKWQICPQGGLTTYLNQFCGGSGQTFLSNGNDNCQDQAEIAYQKNNWAALQGVTSYIGQTKNGITITQAGLMGAAQLCGVGGAIEWLKGSESADGNGTTCSQYFANFAKTILPPQFPGAGGSNTQTAGNTNGGSCPAQQMGQGGANPAAPGTVTPVAATTPATTSPAGTSPSSDSSSMMAMMMMMPMMMMMSQMMSQMMKGSSGSGSGSTGGSGGSSGSYPLTSALQNLFGSGTPSNNTGSSSGSGTPSTSQVLQQLQQLEAQQTAAQQGGTDPSGTTQPVQDTSGNGKKDYRLTCASLSSDPTVQNCHSYVPPTAPQ